MRVAVCLSGQPRYVEHAFPSIKAALIDPNDADVFIHTWFHESMVGVPYRTDDRWMQYPHARYQPNTDKIILELYKPKKYIIEPQRIFKDPNIQVKKTIETFNVPYYTEEYYSGMLYSSWYSVYQANLLKEQYRLENNFNYDYVIRARLDANINRQVMCSSFDPNTLHTCVRHGLPATFVDDWLGFASDRIMNIYSNVFNFMPYLYDICMRRDGLFCSEIIIADMLRLFNVKHCILTDLSNEPIRPWQV